MIAGPDGAIRPEVLLDPYRLYRDLRDTDPVRFDAAVNGWLITRYTDVHDLVRDERMSARRTRSYFSGLPDIDRDRFALFRRTREDMLLFSDPPRHGPLRQIIGRALGAAVNGLATESVDRHVRRLAARIAKSGGGDIVGTMAVPLPMLVLMDLLGVPERDADFVLHHSTAFNAALGGVIRPDLVATAEAALETLAPYLERLAANPPAGTILAPLRAAVDGGQMTTSELMATAVMLVSAGHETTTNLIANATLTLARHNHVQDALTSRRITIGEVLDEVLRYDAPVQLTAREAVSEIQVGSQMIAPGERAILLWGSANRDPDVFSHPDTFQPGRHDGGRMLSFGAGPHRCPGARLARLESEAAISSLLTACGRLELARPPEWKPNFSFRAPSELVLGAGKHA